MNWADLEKAVNSFWTTGEPATGPWTALLTRLAKLLVSIAAGGIGFLFGSIPLLRLVLEIGADNSYTPVVSILMCVMGLLAGAVVGLKSSWDTILVFAGTCLGLMMLAVAVLS